MNRSCLRITRHSARYRMARDHPDPNRLAARLDEAAAAIGHYLAACLEPLSAGASEAVCVIRQIEVELDLDAATAPDLIAAAWGAAIARSVIRRLDNGDGIAHFTDRAAYLGGFLRDLAAGTAWRLWYYGPYEGLRLLPIAAALRTAILADVATGRRALLGLDPGDLRRVLEVLTPVEARRILDELAAAGEDRPPAPEAGPAAPQRGWDLGLSGDRLALATFLALMRSGPDTARAALTAPDAAAPGTGPRHTRYGGLFLLLPQLAALPVEALAGHSNEAGPADESLFRLLVLAACAGEEAADAVFLDPVWRDLFSIPGGFRLGERDAWTASFPAAVIDALSAALGDAEIPAPPRGGSVRELCEAAAARVLRQFSQRLPGFAGSSAPYLWRNFLCGVATVELRPEALCVTLERPPLDLVLGLAGLTRTRFALPWLDRPVEMRPED